MGREGAFRLWQSHLLRTQVTDHNELMRKLRESQRLARSVAFDSHALVVFSVELR